MHRIGYDPGSGKGTAEREKTMTDTRPEYAIAYQPTRSRPEAPWVVQIVRADGRNLTAARKATEQEARELVALLTREAVKA